MIRFLAGFFPLVPVQHGYGKSALSYNHWTVSRTVHKGGSLPGSRISAVHDQIDCLKNPPVDTGGG